MSSSSAGPSWCLPSPTTGSVRDRVVTRASGCATWSRARRCSGDRATSDPASPVAPSSSGGFRSACARRDLIVARRRRQPHRIATPLRRSITPGPPFCCADVVLRFGQGPAPGDQGGDPVEHRHDMQHTGDMAMTDSLKSAEQMVVQLIESGQPVARRGHLALRAHQRGRQHRGGLGAGPDTAHAAHPPLLAALRRRRRASSSRAWPTRSRPGTSWRA